MGKKPNSYNPARSSGSGRKTQKNKQSKTNGLDRLALDSNNWRGKKPRKPKDPWSQFPLNEPVRKPVLDASSDPLHKIVPLFDREKEFEGSEYTSQMEALYYLMRGDNMILCGQAGAGKSWVIDTYRRIIDRFNARMEAEDKRFVIAITASTGIAASLIMGKTIHSWSGLGISVDSFDPRKLKGKSLQVWKNAERRIRGTDCLIIDEVSMLPAYFLTNLDRACRVARRKPNQPFGGLQVVLVGDFLQLPPVDTGQKDSEGNPVNASYCFTAKTQQGKSIFGTSGFKWCYLDKVRRSKDDRLTDLLNHIRTGSITANDLKNLKSRYGLEKDARKTYTQLRTTNYSVDAFNQKKLDSLPGEATHYGVSWRGDPDSAKEMRKNLTDVDLKPGAVVMLTANMAVPDDDSCVNGSMGTVMACDRNYVTILFNNGEIHDVRMLETDKTEIQIHEDVDEETGLPIVNEEEVIIASTFHMPVKLAWAITIHKSQGQTLDGAEIDMSRCFTKGLGYVALSRCRSLDDLLMKGRFDDLPIDALKLDENALKADVRIRDHAKTDRKLLLESEDKVAELESVKRVSSSKAAVDRIQKQIDEIGSMGIIADDEAAYEWIKDHRARRIPLSKRQAKRGLD